MRRSWHHTVHLVLGMLAGALWFRVWPPFGLYLLIVLFKDATFLGLLHTEKQKIYDGFYLFQRLLYAWLAVYCALAIDPSEMISVFGVGIVMFGAIRELAGNNGQHVGLLYGPTGLIVQSDRNFASVFGTLAILPFFFAKESIASSAWIVSVVIGLFLGIKPFLEERKVTSSGVIRNTRKIRISLLILDMIWILTAWVLLTWSNR